jgi:hypothetical protein
LLGGAALLRLDVWFAGDSRLVLGGLPVSLAYHVAFALAMTGLMALLAHRALPRGEEGEAMPRPSSPGDGA